MQKKDLTTGLALTFFFGPIGMIYTSVVCSMSFLMLNLFLLTIFLFAGSMEAAPLLRVGYLIVLVLELFATYNIINEKNKRIDNKEIPMTREEEFDLGFQNTSNTLLVFLVSIFFTCCIYALLSLTHMFDKMSNSFQGIIFFIVLIASFLIFSFVKKTKKLA